MGTVNQWETMNLDNQPLLGEARFPAGIGLNP